jgi:hypothetical protein
MLMVILVLPEHSRVVERQRLRWQSNCGYDPRLYATNISAPGIRSHWCRGSNQRTSSGDSFHPSGISSAHRAGRREYDAVVVSQATWPAGCKPCGESRWTEETPPENVRCGSEEDQRGSEEAVGGSEGEGVTRCRPRMSRTPQTRCAERPACQA